MATVVLQFDVADIRSDITLAFGDPAPGMDFTDQVILSGSTGESVILQSSNVDGHGVSYNETTRTAQAEWDQAKHGHLTHLRDRLAALRDLRVFVLYEKFDHGYRHSLRFEGR